MQPRIAVRDVRKSFDHEVTSLLLMNSPEKQEQALFAQLREARVEGGKLNARVSGGSTDAVADHDFLTRPVQRERFPGESPLLVAREQHRLGVAQHAGLPRPVQALLDVFERMRALEPGIEHAVSKN